jgi:hypothetical protein
MRLQRRITLCERSYNEALAQLERLQSAREFAPSRSDDVPRHDNPSRDREGAVPAIPTIQTQNRKIGFVPDARLSRYQGERSSISRPKPAPPVSPAIAETASR